MKAESRQPGHHMTDMGYSMRMAVDKMISGIAQTFISNTGSLTQQQKR
jgi:hypothetical protein